MHFVPGRLDKPSLQDVGSLSGRFESGNMILDSLLDVDDIRIGAAVFQPGSHTWWHKHSVGQIFLVERGRGVVANRQGEVQILGPGDILHTPAGEEHWHGAGPDSVFIYTVISLGTTDFCGDQTTPEQYAAAWE